VEPFFLRTWYCNAQGGAGGYTRGGDLFGKKGMQDFNVVRKGKRFVKREKRMCNFFERGGAANFNN